MTQSSRRSAAAPGAPSKATQRVQRYVQYEAHLNPSAQALAAELKMPLCSPTAAFPGLMPYIDRLVSTGRDTPNNMSAWFGPHWEEGTREMHHQSRMATLSAPWPPSPYINVYVNFHALGRPRPPSKEEQAELKAMLDYSTRSQSRPKY